MSNENRTAIVTGASKGVRAAVAKRLAADGFQTLGRIGQPDDIARIVSFLAGPEGGWINGQVVKANGGRN